MEESNEEKYITLPNGGQISVEDYFDTIIDKNFVFGMYKLKTEDGKTESISSREFIERFIGTKEDIKFISDANDIKNLINEKVENIYIDDKYIESEFEFAAGEIMKMKKKPNMSFVIQGFCGKNMSNVDMRGLSQEYFKRLTFDGNTQFPKNPDLMPKFIREQNEFENLSEYANNLMEQGKSFVNIEQLHKEGINGEGTTIALIDSCFDSSAKEFEGRVAKHIIFKENKDTGKIELVIEHDEDNPDIKYSHEDYGDDFHGKTTASLAAGKECGVAPNAKLYLFGIAENTNWEKAKEAILKYMQNEIQNEKMKLPDIISMSANKENTQEANDIIGEFEKAGCTLLDSSEFWKNFLWGRVDGDGNVKLDQLMETIAKMPYDKESKAGPVIEKIKNASSTLVPCTQRTSYSEDRRL